MMVDGEQWMMNDEHGLKNPSVEDFEGAPDGAPERHYRRLLTNLILGFLIVRRMHMRMLFNTSGVVTTLTGRML